VTRSVDPIIFRGLKSLTLRDTQQQSLLRLAAEGISVRGPLRFCAGTGKLKRVVRSTARIQQSTARAVVSVTGLPTSSPAHQPKLKMQRKAKRRR